MPFLGLMNSNLIVAFSAPYATLNAFFFT